MSRVPFRTATALPQAPDCTDRDVHLWAVSLVQPAARLARFHTQLSADERRRAAGFRVARHRDRYVAAHGLLRSVLGTYTGLPPGRIEFTTGAHGKPALMRAGPHAPLQFNLAHSGDHLLVGIARHELGVDLEVLRPGRHFLRLAARFFAASEVDALRTVTASARAEAFYNAWTRKEAYIKALGTGLSEPLDAFDVTLLPGDPARVVRIADRNDDPAAWSLYDLRPDPELVGALALRGRGWSVQAWRIAPRG